MANKENQLVKVWDDDNLIKESIDFLRTPTQKVNFPISEHIKQMVEDLVDTYKAMTCAGIAANQVGFNKSIFVGMEHDREKSISEDSSQNIDDIVLETDNYEIYINPQIDKIDKNSTQFGEEGCLSIPGLSLKIERYDNIKIRYYNIDGKAIKKPLSGFISRLFQHELDHLNGNLMFESLIGRLDLDYVQDGISSETLQQLFDIIHNTKK
jgi:peptide deformylase